ncbi:hypothetical protein F4778DRAFT_490061 [Xylariomycetidae sp. FL2044]|nr:hypothetical protein F4778DRAFT_490061 [Xylariomycetidae sp. FL2044]
MRSNFLPKLSIFSSSRSSTSTSTSTSTPSPASVFSPPSASSSKCETPLTPPARLHLRNVLPCSPDALMTPPPPPRTPYAWLWQCRSCQTIYRLGCTQRCLLCGYSYCVPSNPPNVVPHRPRKRRRNGDCASEFDYNGWEEWGAWRRKVLGHEARGRTGEAARRRAFATKRHDCWTDCNYPSECNQVRFMCAAEAREKRYALEDSSDDEPESPVFARAPRSPDDDLVLNEALELGEGMDEDKEPRSPTSPKSPPSRTSFDWTAREPSQHPQKKAKKETKAWWSSRSKGHKAGSQQGVEQSSQDTTGASPVQVRGSADPNGLDKWMDEDQKLMPLVGSWSQPTIAGKLAVRNATDDDLDNWSSDDSDSEDSDDSFSSGSSSSVVDEVVYHNNR